jgi:hypothetical protein
MIINLFLSSLTLVLALFWQFQVYRDFQCRQQAISRSYELTLGSLVHKIRNPVKLNPYLASCKILIQYKKPEEKFYFYYHSTLKNFSIPLFEKKL